VIRRDFVNNPALKGEACEEPYIARSEAERRKSEGKAYTFGFSDLDKFYVRIVITPLDAPPVHRSSLAL